MITLKKDKEIVKVETWQDVLELPGYEKDINPDQIKLKEIIGYYEFDDEVSCGLSNCHQGHLYGYIVTTHDGRITNIGNVCGKRNFSADFNVLRNQFNKDNRIKSYKEKISTHKNLIPNYRKRISKLRIDGGDYCHNIISKFTNRNLHVPDEVVTTLHQMLKADDRRILKVRATTEDEKDFLEELGQKQTEFIEEEIGLVNGLKALSPENDIRKILIEDLTRGLSTLNELDLNQCTEHQLSIHSKWCDEIELKFNKAKSAIEVSKQFCSKYNLVGLQKLIESQTDRKKYINYIRSLEKELKASNQELFTRAS
jgi:hypothetical protein